MSSPNFAATSTDSDETAASVAQVPAWAFVIAWSTEEPHRAGEIAFLPPFRNVLLGRGDLEMPLSSTATRRFDRGKPRR